MFDLWTFDGLILPSFDFVNSIQWIIAFVTFFTGFSVASKIMNFVSSTFHYEERLKEDSN